MKHALSILILLANFAVTAQENTSSIGVSGGYATNGYGGIINYNYSLNENGYLFVAGTISLSEDEQDIFTIPYETFGFNLGYFYRVYKDRFGRSTLSIGGGGRAAYQRINEGEETLSTGAIVNSESKFIHGAFVGAEFDFKLNDTFAIYATAIESYHSNSDIGSFSFYGGIGLKYLIY